MKGTAKQARDYLAGITDLSAIEKSLLPFAREARIIGNENIENYAKFMREGAYDDEKCVCLENAGLLLDLLVIGMAIGAGMNDNRKIEFTIPDPVLEDGIIICDGHPF